MRDEKKWSIALAVDVEQGPASLVRIRDAYGSLAVVSIGETRQQALEHAARRLRETADEIDEMVRSGS